MSTGSRAMALEPVFADQAGEIGRAAGRDRQPVELGEIERQIERLRAAAGEIEIMRQRVRDHFRLLVDFLFHEMPVVALVDHEAGRQRLLALALDRVAVHVEDRGPVAADDGPVAVFEIGDRVGERRKRDGVGAEEHLALAMADGQRRAVAGADDQVLVALEHDGQRKGAFQPLQRVVRGRYRVGAALQFARDQMGDHLGVGLRGKDVAVGDQFVAQLGEILDDAVVDHGDAVGKMRMRVGLVGNAMRCPARVADADGAVERLGLQPLLEIDQLAFGAAAAEHAVLDGRDAGRIIAAIFEPFQRIDDKRRYRRSGRRSRQFRTCVQTPFQTRVTLAPL